MAASEADIDGAIVVVDEDIDGVVDGDVDGVVDIVEDGVVVVVVVLVSSFLLQAAKETAAASVSMSRLVFMVLLGSFNS